MPRRSHHVLLGVCVAITVLLLGAMAYEASKPAEVVWTERVGEENAAEIAEARCDAKEFTPTQHLFSPCPYQDDGTIILMFMFAAIATGQGATVWVTRYYTP